MANKPVTTAAEWRPQFVLDLDDSSKNALTTIVASFKQWANSLPVEPTGMTDGWATITPELAESLLKRNVSNRKISISTVRYYARQMKGGVWMRTGQPVILNDRDELLDSQHRLWACYLSGASFDTYVVTNVPASENLFAYIDNGKTRTATDALTTAGINGLSNVIAQAVKLSNVYDAGAFTVMATKQVEKQTPAEVLDYVAQHAQIKTAAHLQIGEYKTATAIIRYRDVAVFAAFKILEGFGEEVLDDFMGEIANTELAEGSPILLFRKKMAEDLNSAEPMPKHHVLAHLTKTFNAWRLSQPLRRLTLKTDERWPTFADAEVDVAA